MENRNKNFWKTWFKFVGVLIAVFLVWLLMIFLCDKILGDKFEKIKFVHYFILLVVVLKVKKWFLKEVDYKKEESEIKEESEEKDKNEIKDEK